MSLFVSLFVCLIGVSLFVSLFVCLMGVKDLFKEEWVDRVSSHLLMTVLVLVVLEGVVVRVGVEGWWTVFRRK